MDGVGWGDWLGELAWVPASEQHGCSGELKAQDAGVTASPGSAPGQAACPAGVQPRPVVEGDGSCGPELRTSVILFNPEALRF